MRRIPSYNNLFCRLEPLIPLNSADCAEPCQRSQRPSSSKGDNDPKARLEEWIGIVSHHLPHLSKPQAVVLALWSFGIVMSKSCGLTTVASFIASLLGQEENTVRQRLREWYRNDEAKKGGQRTELDVNGCFVPLVGWGLSWWASEERRLVLAMDASTLGQLFVVLAPSIVYRDCAILNKRSEVKNLPYRVLQTAF